MKSNTTPQRPALRVISVSLLVATFTTGAVVLAQQPPKAVPVPPPAELPAADEPARPPKAAPVPPDEPAPAGPSRTGRIPVPEEGAPPAVEPAVATDRAPSPSLDYQPDPRTKTIIRRETDASGLTRTVVQTLLDEEVSANPQDAARKYEAVIAAFDSQRANAAQAIFRLGETYRKLNRLDEARVQYARILREFVDFPDLARLSQQQFSQNPPAVAGGGGMTGEGSPVAGFAARAAAVSAEERKLLSQEIDLLEEQLLETQQLVKTGTAPAASLIPIQREILQLKRQLLRHENSKDPVRARNAVAPSVKEEPATKP